MSQANHWRVLAEPGGVFTFTVSNVMQKQFCLFESILRSSADLQSYDSEFQTEGTLSPITLATFVVQQVTVYQQIE